MFNPACEKLFKFQAREIIGQNVKMLMPAPYRAEHDGYLNNFHRTRVRKVIGIGREVTGQRKDGSTFPMNLSVGEAIQDGESIFFGIIHYLTERKKTEEHLVQAQKIDIVGHLSGWIAHDFNNLLTVIVGNSEFLSDQLKPRPDLRQLADDIGQAGERGAELTQRLLAFSRRQTLRPIEIDCNKLLESMYKLLRRTMREDIEIKIDFDPDIPLAFADPAQLESAILNLGLNAQDAMTGGGSLTLSTASAFLDDQYQMLHPEVRPGEYVLVAITDTARRHAEGRAGAGLRTFFTTKEVGKGSGLGLSMVYGFVKKVRWSRRDLQRTRAWHHRANVFAGATNQTVEGAAQGRMHERRAMVGGPETVLVVEDDAFVRAYAVKCLQSLGYSDCRGRWQRRPAKTRHGCSYRPAFTDVVMPASMVELADLAQRSRPRGL